MKRIHLLLLMVCFVGSLFSIVSGYVYLSDRFGLWGLFNDPNLPVYAIVGLIMFADVILDAKRPKFAGDNGGL